MVVSNDGLDWDTPYRELYLLGGIYWFRQQIYTTQIDQRGCKIEHVKLAKLNSLKTTASYWVIGSPVRWETFTWQIKELIIQILTKHKMWQNIHTMYKCVVECCCSHYSSHWTVTGIQTVTVRDERHNTLQPSGQCIKALNSMYSVQ